MKLFNETSDILSKLLDAASLRQRVIAANLANVNTPGYKSRDVRFEEMLRGLIGGEGRPGGAKPPEPEIVERSDVRARADGNTVDLEREVGEMTRNALVYQTYVRFLDHQFATMRAAITGRNF